MFADQSVPVAGALAELVVAGLVDLEEARRRAVQAQLFEVYLGRAVR